VPAKERLVPDPEDQTHFGYDRVPTAEKAERVRGVFRSVAARYDLMNDLMSAGLHRLWKDALVDWLAPRPGLRLLDVAGGTGDVAFRVLARAPGARATVLDLTEPMLREGRARAEARALAGRVDWVVGDAMALPFPDASFDAYTISFGIRNVARPEAALAEAHRVLRRGGRLLVLEFSRVPEGLRGLYDAYSFAVIPRLGRAVTGDGASYRYLVESIRRFPDQEAVLDMVAAAGFGRVAFRNLSLGVACLHSGWKL
jgi:demethylmenaquinone methyltransferase/2-methoxy-6-polyprenyl-1,4-benzoquinol methylase